MPFAYAVEGDDRQPLSSETGRKREGGPIPAGLAAKRPLFPVALKTQTRSAGKITGRITGP
jgi:hypothetical protein